MLPDRVERIVLIGLMGAGKTTIGQLLAQRLGWSFIDLDAEIESRASRSVAQIFEQEGEGAFRQLERQLASELLSKEHIVLAPGGGWIVQPGAVRQLAPESAVFWLQVSPAEAVRRVQQDAAVRPLLQQGDPLTIAQRLAAERTRMYEEHGVPIQTEQRTPVQIVADIIHTLGARIPDARALHESNG